MPSSAKAKEQILLAIPANIQGVIYELGSGWGTLAFPLAKKFPDHQIVALEISPVPWLFSKIRNYIFYQKNLKILRHDFMSYPLQDAAVVVCYLYPEAMNQLKKKLESELPSKTLVISNTFAIPGWKPTEVFVLDDLYQTKIYQYN